MTNGGFYLLLVNMEPPTSFPKGFRRLLSRNVNALERQKHEMTLCKKHFWLSSNAVTLGWNLLEQEAQREYTEVQLQSLGQN